MDYVFLEGVIETTKKSKQTFEDILKLRESFVKKDLNFR